jgi:hypothetical protein
MTLLCPVKGFGGWARRELALLEETKHVAGDDPFEVSFGVSEGLLH